jgi:Spy/CpxP family protein refolding chaperone
MKNRVLTIAGATVLAAGMIFAQTQTATTPEPGAPAGHARFHRGMMMARLANKLNLTDAQRGQAKAIFQDLRTQAQPIRAQLRQGRQALMNAAESGQSTDQINQLAQAQAAPLSQLAALRAQAFGKFYATLTPAQQRQFQAMQSKRSARTTPPAQNN